MFRSARIASAVAAALALSACSSDSVEEILEPNDDLLPGQSIQGRAADGYLNGARVCLDLNSNSVCDQGEPTTQSGEGGQFSFEDLPALLDLDEVRVVVEVLPGETVDEDNPGAPVEKGYTLSSPPGQTDFVSPITTMIDVQMKNAPELDLDQAKELVKQRLGISDAVDVDLMDDYVARKQEDPGQSEQPVDEAAKAEYARLHHIAQVVTHAIADNLEQIDEAVDTLPTEASFKDTLAAVVDNISDEVQQITDEIDQSIAKGEEIDPQALVEDLKDQLQLAVEELQDAIDELEEKREASQQQMEQLLTQQGGLFFLESDEYREYRPELNDCVIEKEIGYGQFRVVEGQSEWMMRHYDPVTGQFQRVERDAHPHYSLKQGEWQLVESFQPELIGYQEDAALISLPGEGEQMITAKQLPLAELPLEKVAGDDHIWAAHLALEQSSFPEGAAAYLLSSKQLSDHHVIPVWDDCDDQYQLAGNCNLVRVGGEPVSAWGDLINSEWHDAPAQAKLFPLFPEWGEEILVAVVEIRGDNSDDTVEHFAKFFKRGFDAAGTAPELELLGVGDWYISDETGQELLHLIVPSWLKGQWYDDNGHPFLALQGEAIRQGIVFSGGNLQHETLTLNAVAMETLLEAFHPSDLRWELPAEACGVYPQPEQPGEEEDPGKDPEDGTEPTPEPTPVKPELESDPQLTEQLAGKIYFGQADEETVLVQFAGFDDMIAFWQDVEADGSVKSGSQVAHWIVDAEQQLLLDFGQDDWTLLNVHEGLGDQTMVLTEQDDEELNRFVLNQIHPMTTSAIVPGAAISVIDADENCVLDIYLNGDASVAEGSGYVDATACAETAEDMGQQFELLWYQGQMGELVLKPVTANGELSDEVLHLFVKEQADGIQLVMVFEPLGHEEWEWHAFETWYLIQE